MYDRIIKHFEDVRDFVSRRFKKFANFKLNIGCPLIEQRRKYHPEGYRAYMHTGHYKNTICVHPLAEKLGSKYLYGLFLHEFGHHFPAGQKAGELGQMGADLSVLDKFGKVIRYGGKKELQYIRSNPMLKYGKQVVMIGKKRLGLICYLGGFGYENTLIADVYEIGDGYNWLAKRTARADEEGYRWLKEWTTKMVRPIRSYITDYKPEIEYLKKFGYKTNIRRNPRKNQGEVWEDEVWELETPSEKVISDKLSYLCEKALKGDRKVINFLRKVWDGESWQSIKSKLLTEGSDWYVWWMDGVRKIMGKYKGNPLYKEKRPFLRYKSQGKIVRRIADKYGFGVANITANIQGTVDIGIDLPTGRESRRDFNRLESELRRTFANINDVYIWGRHGQNPEFESSPIIAIYDNGGKTLDRYTIVLSRQFMTPSKPYLYVALSLSDYPDSPYGFSQFGEVRWGKHLGKALTWQQLPKRVQEHITRRLFKE